MVNDCVSSVIQYLKVWRYNIILNGKKREYEYFQAIHWQHLPTLLLPIVITENMDSTLQIREFPSRDKAAKLNNSSRDSHTIEVSRTDLKAYSILFPKLTVGI
jgi:hypothetical protein